MAQLLQVYFFAVEYVKVSSNLLLIISLTIEYKDNKMILVIQQTNNQINPESFLYMIHSRYDTFQSNQLTTKLHSLLNICPPRFRYFCRCHMVKLIPKCFPIRSTQNFHLVLKPKYHNNSQSIQISRLEQLAS